MGCTMMQNCAVIHCTTMQIWPGRDWTGPSGKHRQDTFSDGGQPGLKNGFGHGVGWGDGLHRILARWLPR